MTGRRSKGVSKSEFDHLVDGGFSESLPEKRGRRSATRPDMFRFSEKELDQLEAEGAAPGLSKVAARVNGAFRRIFGTTAPTTEKSVEFLKEMDTSMKELVRKQNLHVDDD